MTAALDGIALNSQPKPEFRQRSAGRYRAKRKSANELGAFQWMSVGIAALRPGNCVAIAASVTHL